MKREGAIKNEKGEILKAGGAIIEDGKILLVSNEEGTAWSFPKGHQEEDETPEETALREMREETGYEVEIVKRLSDLSYKNKETGEPIRVAMFKARPIKEVGKNMNETESKWFTIEEAKKALYHKPSYILDEID